MGDVGLLRVAYVSESYGPHDFRFLEAIARVAGSGWHIRLGAANQDQESRPSPVGDRGTVLIPTGEFGQRVDALRMALSQIKPDLVHAGPLQRVTFPVVLATDLPVIAASWGSDLLRDAQEDQVWRDVAAFSLSRARGFLGDCRAVLRLAIELGFQGSASIIPWGIDLSRFCPDGASRKFGPADSFVILSTRNWEEVYDVATLARAFIDLEVDTNVHLVLCGAGSQEDLLRSILEKATANGQVTWIGRASQADLPKIYRSADLYVSTSKGDGTSVSLLEAMGCGLPVLVSNIPGNREWVNHPDHLFPVGDVQALSASLRQFAKRTSTELKALGREGRFRVQLSADWSKAPSKLASLYAEVVA